MSWYNSHCHSQKPNNPSLGIMVRNTMFTVLLFRVKRKREIEITRMVTGQEEEMTWKWGRKGANNVRWHVMELFQSVVIFLNFIKQVESRFSIIWLVDFQTQTLKHGFGSPPKDDYMTMSLHKESCCKVVLNMFFPAQIHFWEHQIKLTANKKYILALKYNVFVFIMCFYISIH